MSAKKKISFNTITIGLIPGIIVPLLTVYFLYIIKNLAMDFNSYIDYLIQYKFITKVLSVALVVNLGVFFIFLQGDRYKSARGVILATFIYAIIIVLYMFIF